MNKVDVAKILAIAGGFDRYITVDELTTSAWYAVLENVHPKPAMDAVLAFYRTWDGKTQLSPARILTHERNSDDIAADVRSAKARRLIGRDWPENDPLPAEVQQRLEDLRTAARTEALALYPADA